MAAAAGTQIRGAVVVVTGGGSGIGAAMCARFARDGAATIVVADLDGDAAGRVAEALRAQYPAVQLTSAAVDVSVEDEVVELVASTSAAHGTIDLFCANAGIGTGAGIDAPDEVWRRIIDVNLMSHVYAARALLPAWLERGRGHLLVTASAAGLLTNLGDAPYSVTKHGAVALAEWLSITYGDRGVTVSCLCPQGVRTPLLFPGGDATSDDPLALEVVRAQRLIEPEDVADAVATALGDGRFLILPHEEVAAYEQARAGDRERWLSAMRRLQSKITGG